MMDIKPLAVLRLFTMARRLKLRLCWSDTAVQAGVSYEAVRHAERGWHQTNSGDLMGLLNWTCLTGTWVHADLQTALNKKLAADTRKILRQTAKSEAA